MSEAKISSHLYLSLALLLSACTELQDEPAPEPGPAEAQPAPDDLVPYAAGDPCFDWPLGGVQGGSFVPGWNTRVMQNYGNRGGAGWYDNRAHSGADLALNAGSTAGAPVYAAASGVVRCVVYANYPGWVTVVEHTMGNGTKKYTQYGHTNQPSVSTGTSVSKGQQIGTVLDQGGNCAATAPASG